MIRKITKENQKFIKHNLFSYVVIVFNIVTSLYAVRENLSFLQKDLYGVWILVLSTTSILGILNFGFNFVAIFKYDYYNKENKLNSFYSNNTFVALSQSLLTILVFLCIYQFSYLFLKNDKYVEIFNTLLLLALPGVIITAISSYIEAVLYFNFKYIYHRNLLEMLRLGVMNVLFVIGLNWSGDIRILPVIYSFVAFVAFGYSLYKFLSKNRISIKFNQLEPNYIAKNSADGFSFWILGISSYVITQTDVVFISMLKNDLGLVTMYSQSFRLQDLALKFIKKITEIKAPKTLALYNSGNHPAVVDIYKKLLKINLLLSSIAFLGISFLGKYVLEIWLNKTIIFDQTLIVVLSLICVTGSIHWVLWNFCNLTGLQKKVRNVVVVEILSNLILSYILLKNFGLVGLGIASIISNSITITYIYSLFAKYTRSHL